MDIDFEIKEIILKKEVEIKQGLGKIGIEIYSKSDIAIRKEWNSLYFANNNSIFAFVEIDKKKYYLKTIGEVLVRQDLPLLEKSDDDVIDFFESYHEYNNDYTHTIRDLIDDNEEFIVKQTNMFVIVESEDVYEALCEKERYIPYTDHPGTLKELEHSLIDFIIKNKYNFSNVVEVRAV